MTQQEQIALLAAALEEVGKMPTDWLVTNGRMTLLYQRCRYNYDMVIDAEPAVLAALSGIAAEEVISSQSVRIISTDDNDYAVCRSYDGLTSWWDTISSHENYHEALIAALKQIAKGKKQ